MKHLGFRLTAISLAVAAAAGCATRTTERPVTAAPSEAPLARADIAALDTPVLGPRNARPGECYTRVFSPAVYENRREQVLKTAATERLEIEPARFEEVQEQVMVKPAATRIEVVPAVYETVEEQVLAMPASTRLETVPAQYETVTERVVVKPAMWVWRKASEGARSDITRVDPSTGEILCLVEVPPQYETVTKQIVKTLATTREVEVPTEYKTVTRQVLKTPATTRQVEVPAEYAMVTVNKMVSPARELRVQVPAEYETVHKVVLAKPAGEEWRQVLCAANATRDDIRRLQDALRAAGYDPGASTGELSRSTLTALQAYQQANQLPVDRGAYVNMTTAESLGVAPQRVGSASLPSDESVAETQQ
ncbi:MAG TPA: peptidoglycan-binding domain-containing protein [Burkholderiales bacterium]|nr:peptidoglycan-binding domain-containing protein [Burkholderiales bacterium]